MTQHEKIQEIICNNCPIKDFCFFVGNDNVEFGTKCRNNDKATIEIKNLFKEKKGK